MNLFITSLILILIGLAMFYPLLFFAFERSATVINDYRKFLQLNYIIHLMAGFFAILLLWVNRVNYPLQWSGVIYLVVAFVVVLFYWNSNIPTWNLFSASIVFGFIVFYRAINEIVEITPLWPGILTGVLSAGAISLAVLMLSTSIRYSRSDGALPSFCKNLLKYLYVFIGIRIIWGIVILFYLSVETQNNEIISAFKFFLHSNPIKLSLLISMGFILPLISWYPIRRQLNSKSPKNPIVLFGVIFISLIFAEFLYKYFLLQYGIVL